MALVEGTVGSSVEFLCGIVEFLAKNPAWVAGAMASGRASIRLLGTASTDWSELRC